MWCGQHQGCGELVSGGGAQAQHYQLHNALLQSKDKLLACAYPQGRRNATLAPEDPVSRAALALLLLQHAVACTHYVPSRPHYRTRVSITVTVTVAASVTVMQAACHQSYLTFS